MNQTIRALLATTLIAFNFTHPANADAQQKFSFESISYNGDIKPEQFNFSDVTIKARSNTNRIVITTTFNNASTPYKSIDGEEALFISLEADTNTNNLYAIRLDRRTFNQTIPDDFNDEGKVNRFLITYKSVQGDKFNAFYEQLNHDDKVKLKGACHYFMDSNNIKKITSLRSPLNQKVISKSTKRVDELLSTRNIAEQIKTLGTNCYEATNRVYVKDIQTFLNASGNNVGKSDGQWGPKSQSGWESYLASQGKPLNTAINSVSIQALQDSLTGKMPMLRKITFKDEFFDTSGELRNHPRHAEVFDTSIKSSERPKYNLDLTNVTRFDDKTIIPWNISFQPNDETLSYYYKISDARRFQNNAMYRIMPSKSPFKFKKALETNNFIDKQMATKTALSYLYYENGSLIYDALPPKGRFNLELDDSSYFVSNSMGKSITSYLIGHAICKGYIESIDAPISDWPLMKNTLYYEQPLINLLNMKAGDTNVISALEDTFKKTGRTIHDYAPLSKAAKNSLELKDTQAIENPRFSYSNLTSNVLINYLMHKTRDNFDMFISNFYTNKIKIEYPIYMAMQQLDVPVNIKNRIENGAGRYGVFATRYDYLRIAKAMMGDWQNNTCEGKYLKEIYKRRVNMNRKQDTWNSKDMRWGYPQFNNTASKYGGQFWTDFHSLWGRNILLMDGASGQQIIMDMDNSRIVVINAIKSNHYNTKKLGFEPIKYGRIR